MNLACLTDGVCQADQAVTCAASDLQHPLAVGDPERPNTKVTDCVFARIGDEIVRMADAIIETSRIAPCRLSFCHGLGRYATESQAESATIRTVPLHSLAASA